MKNSNTKITGEVIDEGFEPLTSEEYLKETAQLYKQSDMGQLSLAQRFYEIKSKKLYKPLYSCMREFIETELKGMGNSTASRLAGLHEKFVLTLGIKTDEIAKAGWSVVSQALPVINTADEARYWLDIANAEGMTKKAFADLVKEHRAGKPMTDCAHDKAYLIRHCPECGDKWREYDVSIIRNETLAESLKEVGIEATEKQVDTILKSLVKKAYKHDPESEE